MKKLLYILIIFPSLLFAQVLQFINYEATAYDLNGLAILSQEINVRLFVSLMEEQIMKVGFYLH